MTPQRRAMLSQIMTMAWKKLRWERSVMGRTYTISEALTHAWAWEKGAGAPGPPGPPRGGRGRPPPSR